MQIIEFRPTLTQRAAVRFLRFAEALFLRVHGWKSRPAPDVHGEYQPPSDYPFERKNKYVRVHAVNAQRQVYAAVTKQGGQ